MLKQFREVLQVTLVCSLGAAAQAADSVRPIDVPAGDLLAAIEAVEQQTDAEIVYQPEKLKGLKTGGVSGQFTTQEAVGKLLEGTRLRLSTDASTGAMLIVSVGPVANESGARVEYPIRLAQSDVSNGQAPAAAGEHDKAQEVQEVVVEASKIGSSVVTTPQSVSVISSAEMIRRGAQSMNDVLRYVPGTVADSGGYEARGDERMLLRGFTGYGTANYRDGLRQAGGWFAVPVTEIYNIEQVEVLRGPSSALFGQSDVGGIINRVSKRPSANARPELVAEFGTFERKQIAGDYGAAWNDGETLRYRVVGLGLDTNTQGKYTNGDRPSNRAFFFAPSLAWTPSERTSLVVLTDFRQNRQKGYSYSVAAPDGSSYNDILVGDPDFTRTRLRQASLGYQFAHRLNGTWALQQNFRFSHIDARVSDIYNSSFQADGHTLDRTTVRDVDWLDQSLLDTQLRGDFERGGIRQTLLVGADVSRAHWDLNYFTGVAPSLDYLNPVYGGPIAEADTLLIDRTTLTKLEGVYAQHQSRFGEHWILTLGSRYDWAALTTLNNAAATRTRQRDNALTTRAGLSYLAGNGFAPYLSFAESFLPQAGADYAGTPFNPTRGRQYEVGVKYQPNGFRGLFTAALFDLTKTNVQTPDRDHYGFRNTTGEVTSRGLELEANVELAERVNVAATYSYLDIEVSRSFAGDVGKSPIQTPRQTASLWLDYGALVQGLTLSGGVRYTGRRYDDALNITSSPAFTLVDIGVRYESGPWQYALNGTNIFDKFYLQSRAFGAYFWGYERAVTASLKYRW